MLIKFVFFSLFLSGVFSLSNHIEAKWSSFEIAIKNRFENLLDKNFTNNIRLALNQKYDKPISGECKTALISLVTSLAQMKSWAVQSKSFSIQKINSVLICKERI